MKNSNEKRRVCLILALVSTGYAVGNILNKAALNTGLSPLIFAVYRDTIAAIVLLLFALFFERDKRPTSYSFLKFCVAYGLTGVFAFQLFYMIGLSFISAHSAAALSMTIPIFTVAIAAIFRTEKIGLWTVVGVGVCAGGSAVMTLYRGPVVFSETKGATIIDWSGSYHSLRFEKWQMGTFLILVSTICAAASANFQVPLLARYPAPISTTTISYMVGTILIVIFNWSTIGISSVWTLKHTNEIIAVLYAGIISSALNLSIQAWCVQKVGPVLVISYTPVISILTTILGIVFLKETIHLGSIIGAISVLIGLYLVVSNQEGQENFERSLNESNLTKSIVDSQVSLLENYQCET